mmetsp:Transcript_29985/g.57326  ORF Transcript_29985/g.57326 Transcript_29985/m.57326 type:complete len:370 (+) Transcript_29985:125-1234(+)
MKIILQALLFASTVLGGMGLHTPRLHYPLRRKPFPLKQSKPASVTALNMAGSSSFGPTATRHLAVAGRIPWHKLLLTKAQALQIVYNIREQTHVLDLGIMFGVLAFSQNIVKFLYTRVFRLFRKDVEYNQSVTNQVVENIRQAAGLGLLCYVFDIIEIVTEVAGIDNTNMNFSSLLSKLLYATWAAFRVRTYKRSFFAATFDKTKKWTKVQSGTEGKVEIVDKVTDFFLFGILALIWIDILEIKRGNGLSSIFALGGASTFVITLACQDLAKKVLNGLAISTSDVFAVGDAIQLGDGTSGTVKSVGWLSTEIRGGDEIVTKIPNTQLSNIRVSNLSRMRQSQVYKYILPLSSSYFFIFDLTLMRFACDR